MTKKTFMLIITHDPKAANQRGAVGVQFQGDDDIAFAAVLGGIKTFLNDAEKRQGKSKKAHTVGELYPEERAKKR